MTQKRKKIPQKIIDELLVEAMHRCCLCPQHEDITDLHHIVPISEEGPNTKENLMVVCPTCHAKIHRIRGRYTPTQLKMYKERWVDLCAKGLPLDERLREAPGIMLDSLHNQTPPEPNFVGRVDMLKTITKWYKHPEVRIGALIGWGGVGKSALIRKWYDSLHENKIHPDGIFWWGFYRNVYLEPFLNALLRYVSQAEIDPDTIKSTWEKVDRIKEHISKRAYLIILDGLEQMQKSESGDEFGKMMHRECTELLHYLADTRIPGLCLITSLYPVKELDNWREHSYKTLPLIDLSIPDALAMLRKRGVKGNDEDLKEVIERYKGHALSLTSVAGFVKRYHDGDITKAPRIEFVFSDKERFKDVNKLLRKYADKMSERELAFLKIFSLFRKEITEKEFAGVFRHKIEGTTFNDVLVKINELDFKDLVDGLVDWRLISYDKTKKSYTTHPLIKAYFKTAFYDEDKELCHKRIYEYFGEHAPDQPETLEEMAPLFEQVYHGCAAGLYDEARRDVYWNRILKREKFFLFRNLGAWETDLSLLRNFFPEGDLSRLPLASNKKSQSWLLNSAGLVLVFTGRPREAREPLLTGVQMDIAAGDWKSASTAYDNLCELQFRVGEIKDALESAKKSLGMAQKVGLDYEIMTSKVYLGHILHLSGARKEAEKRFKEADEVCAKISPYRLHRGWGVFYADFLISIKSIGEALELTRQNLDICQADNSVNDLCACHRCLAAIERTNGNHKVAKIHAQKALELARKIGLPFLEIETLLEYGRLYLDTEKHKDAISAGNEVLRLCDRTGFSLYEPDAEVILGKAYLAQKEFDQAKKFANSALSKAKKMGYRLAEDDASSLLKEIRSKES